MRGYLGKTKQDHPCWKGGQIIDRDGYVKTWAPDHPWPRKGYLREHIRVIELSIGRRIFPNECVHHKDHDRKNNAIENLELMNRGEHSQIHSKLTKDQAKEIILACHRKESSTVIGKRYGIAPNYARSIYLGTAWKCLDEYRAQLRKELEP